MLIGSLEKELIELLHQTTSYLSTILNQIKMKKLKAIIGLLLMCGSFLNAQDSTGVQKHNEHNEHDHHQHKQLEGDGSSPSSLIESYAPLGVMGDHVHLKGEWMVSYRFMTMVMNGNLQGSSEISDMNIYQNYMLSPQSMAMDMHMVGVMYAPSNSVTLMVMGSYVKTTMDVKMMSGMEFSTRALDLGDTKFAGLFNVFHGDRHKLHANIGLNIPTGKVHLTDDTPMMNNAHLAYPMQTGSGTWDPFAGFTYLGQKKLFSWGLQSMYTARFMENEHEYQLGNSFEATSWLVVNANSSLSFSLRAKFNHTDKIQGENTSFNPMMMPLFNTSNSGAKLLNGLGGMTYLFDSGTLKNLSVGLEVGYPLMQNVNGIQMNNDWSGIVGVRYAIGEHHHHH